VAVGASGHSYDGGVALRFALSQPERLRTLTLVEPSSFHVLRAAEGSDARLLDEIRATTDAVNHGVICGDHASGMPIFIDYWGGSGSWESLPDDKKAQFAQLAADPPAPRRSRQCGAQVDARGMRDWLRSMRR